ncbi:MAG: 2-deoxy-5-keto-D-gluconate 6-phosphate aldolase domain-containing protein [Candidatus Woesearchaeota archaeon]
MKHSKQLLILPFDHRSSFSKTLMGYDEKRLTASQHNKISYMKNVVFEGFIEYAKKYKKNKDEFGILVDEEYGKSILKRANQMGVMSCSPSEKSGQKVFQLDYGSKFKGHIERVNPAYVKVLVRYNPGNKKDNKIQLERLKKLDSYCRKTDRQFLFELLVPPTENELKTLGKKRYDKTKRITNTIKALEELSKELYVDVWKLEGFDSKKAWQDIISALNKKTINKDFSIVVLGRGENKDHVIKWLKIASKFHEINGFAVGRTIFMQPLIELKEGKINRSKAIKKISDNFRFFVNLWLKEKNIQLS